MFESDFLVIGSGIAGITFALKAANYGTVNIITKKEKAESNTNYAQGGIASVMGKNDSFDQHIQDTLKCGADICHEESVRLIVETGPDRIKELMNWGVDFSRTKDGELDLGREGGHSQNRIVHAKDLTGREVEEALLDAVKENPNISVYEDHIAIELITEHHLDKTRRTVIKQPHCWGAYALNVPDNWVNRFMAKVVLLATGSLGHAYLHSTNPRIATGDGIAMAYRAGAWIGNMEFMQFHPTSLFHPQGNSFLISEAVRGYGGILQTQDGQPFMEEYHEMKDLAPRDIVARAIDAELKKRGDQCVYLDVTHKPKKETKERFPNIYNTCLTYGIDITKEPIPVVPAAHYTCGGVTSDINARTSIIGLYAAGEVGFTGVHGANRLASNSLLEALAFANQAYLDSIEYFKTVSLPKQQIPEWSEEGIINSEEWVLISHDRQEIQQIMWDYVGIVRSDLRLSRAERRLRLIANEIEDFYKRTRVSEGLLELRNLACVAILIIECARFRKESRGLHFNTDYPDRDDQFWKHDTLIHQHFGIQMCMPQPFQW